jgi:Sec-independent protein translocase protein TatA
MVGLDNPLHIGLALVVALLIFGAQRLPGMGTSLGAGLRGFGESLPGRSIDDEFSVGDSGMQISEESTPTPDSAGAPVGPGRTPSAT